MDRRGFLGVVGAAACAPVKALEGLDRPPVYSVDWASTGMPIRGLKRQWMIIDEFAAYKGPTDKDGLLLYIP